jgi:arylsulfatase A-like enzyme
LIDDVGFGASSVFGGPCQTPNCERLAAAGLRYTRFHTTALCSPTRAALLSGRNHHSVGMRGITEIATSAPGYNSLRPNTKAAIAEVLGLNGYATAQFGKCHEVPVWETSPAGPFDHWPSPGGGFEYFYGFIGGETNQYYPAIYEGMTPLEPPKSGGGLPLHRGHDRQGHHLGGRGWPPARARPRQPTSPRAREPSPSSNGLKMVTSIPTARPVATASWITVSSSFQLSPPGNR